MKPDPAGCPLCDWAGKEPFWRTWEGLARHVAVKHTRGDGEFCPCGLHYRDFPMYCRGNVSRTYDYVAQHLHDQDDLAVHLVLGAIARIGDD